MTATAVRSAQPSAPAAPPASAPATSPVLLRAAPRREPPFDDELEDVPMPGPWDRLLPFAGPTAPPCPIPLPPRRDALPQPGPWARRLLIGLIECADGRRPLQQLSAMLSFSIGRGLAADFERAARTGTRHWLHSAAVRTVRTCEPADGVAELSATVATGQRLRAIALRLESCEGRWRCTRLQLG